MMTRPLHIENRSSDPLRDRAFTRSLNGLKRSCRFCAALDKRPIILPCSRPVSLHQSKGEAIGTECSEEQRTFSANGLRDSALLGSVHSRNLARRFFDGNVVGLQDDVS